MLQQFTWQQFLVATLVLTFLWYVAVILIFYQKELQAFLSKGKQKGDVPLPHRWEKGVDELLPETEDEPEDELMGKSKLPEGMSSVGTDSFGFARRADDREQQVGLVPDVLQEIKEAFAFLAEEDGTKKDFFNLMEVVRNKYPQVGSNPNIGRINEFIAEYAPFHLSKDELESLWD